MMSAILVPFFQLRYLRGKEIVICPGPRAETRGVWDSIRKLVFFPLWLFTALKTLKFPQWVSFLLDWSLICRN